MAMKGYSRFPELESNHQMQFNINTQAPIFLGGNEILPVYRGYCQYILNPADRADVVSVYSINNESVADQQFCLGSDYSICTHRNP